VVLTNAAYFKAQWQMPFEDYKTALQTFKNANQKTVSGNHEQYPLCIIRTGTKLDNGKFAVP
jgi:serine protease inhibitor